MEAKLLRNSSGSSILAEPILMEVTSSLEVLLSSIEFSWNLSYSIRVEAGTFYERVKSESPFSVKLESKLAHSLLSLSICRESSLAYPGPGQPSHYLGHSSLLNQLSHSHRLDRLPLKSFESLKSLKPFNPFKPL